MSAEPRGPLSGPHAGQPVLRSGDPLGQARRALVLLHGRGSSAADILALGTALDLPGAALLAPQAQGGAWYPQPFTRPVEENEPWLSSALDAVGSLLAELNGLGFGPERVGLLGFSQGACLALEYAARRPAPYRGVFGLSGGLIGEADRPRPTGPLLAGVPVLLAVSERDPYIPLERVVDTGEVFRRMGAAVEQQVYRGSSHQVEDEALEAVRRVMG